MYTDCPQCHTTFRVTAQLLRQARGQVRCGGCGNTFDALENLSEEPDGNDLSSSQSVRVFEKRSRELLKSLGDLTDNDNDNVTIEDTGVEWRVLDMDGMNDDDGDAEDEAVSRVDVRINWEDDDTPRDVADDDAAEDEAELAPDDWLTEHISPESGDDDEGDGPGTDGFEVSETSANEIEAIDFADVPEPDDDDDAAGDEPAPQQQAPASAASDGQLRFDDNTPLPDEFYKPVTLQESAEPVEATSDDEPQAAPGGETLRVSIDTGTEQDWQELLTEVDDARPADTADASADTDDESAAADGEDGDEDIAVAAVEPEPAEEQADNDEAPDAAARAAQTETEREEADDAAERERRNAARQTVQDPHEYDIDDSLVESIVMEGDTVTDLLEVAERASYDNIPPPELDDDGELAAAGGSQARSRLAGGVGVGALLLLAATLAAQYLHTNREMLATEPWFQSLVAPVYDLLGQPVSAAWDIRGWQFESTTGSTDDADQHLTIVSRIANESGGALPYPLIHVSLTDRWDEVIGSRVLAPPDYLAGAGNPDRPVAAGTAFAAVITIETPALDATGFKLNVCYPLAGKRLRCAIEDFRQ